MDKELLNNIKEILENIADLAYKGDTNNAIVMFGELLPSIETVATWMDETTREHMLEDALNPILSAMETSDGTMLADVITYELLEILNEM